MGKAVSLLAESDACLACLAGDILVAVQHDLSRERRMAADLNGDVAPLGVQNVKRIVVDIGHWLLSLDVMIGADIPHRRLCPADQDEEQALRDGGPGEIVLCNVMLALS